MQKTVVKASGLKEAFDFEKLIGSLLRSGAPRDIAADIARRVEVQVSPLTHTRHIYKLAKRMLRQFNRASDMKYSLKKAIAALGPSGFPFEQYFARVLKAHGYSVELNRMIEGYCVQHEVDIVASKDGERSVIECKYHTEGGKATDVKVAMYVHSRVEDIKKASAMSGADIRINKGWLVTNTRCTSDAVRYAECTGLKVVGWGHPETESLQKMIERRRLYPVTVLPSLKKQSLHVLFAEGIVLAQEIADMDKEEFLIKSGLDEQTAKSLKAEADRICPCY